MSTASHVLIPLVLVLSLSFNPFNLRSILYTRLRVALLLGSTSSPLSVYISFISGAYHGRKSGGGRAFLNLTDFRPPWGQLILNKFKTLRYKNGFRAWLLAGSLTSRLHSDQF